MSDDLKPGNNKGTAKSGYCLTAGPHLTARCDAATLQKPCPCECHGGRS